MATNPRIDDLRRRLEKEPNSRLFAQLAEELRKDGEFEEAIRILRAGLARHPAYPSARMTLGRALFDTGDMAAARAELQSVLDGAPDNILASRLLAECLEGLGDFEGALKRYKATLALSPGDKPMMARVTDLEGKLHASARPAAAAGPAATSPEPAPIKVAEVNEPMELEISREHGAPAAGPAPAVPLAAAPAEFELETAYDSPEARWRSGSDTVADVPATSAPAPAVPEGERTLADEPSNVVAAAAPAAESFEYPLETASKSAPVVPAAAPVVAEEAAPEAMAPAAAHFPVVAAPAPVPPTPAPPLPEPPAALPPMPAVVTALPEPVVPAPVAPPPLAPPSPMAAPADDAELVSPTLAELYFNQGFPEKAVEVYRRLLERDPGNERARARIAELQEAAAAPREAKPAARPPEPAPAAASGEDEKARAARRQALERTIERLETLRAALQKGAR